MVPRKSDGICGTWGCGVILERRTTASPVRRNTSASQHRMDLRSGRSVGCATAVAVVRGNLRSAAQRKAPHLAQEDGPIWAYHLKKVAN